MSKEHPMRNLNQILFVLATVCLTVALAVTLDWVDAEGAARDAWLILGLGLFTAGHISWT